MSASSSDPIQLPVPHFKYYTPDDMVIIQCEDILFRVSISWLSKHAEFFKGLFEASPTSHLVSTMDTPSISSNNSIHTLDGPVEEFEALLDMVYAAELGFVLDGNKADVWITRLSAAKRWDAKVFYGMACQELANCQDSVAHIVAARQFDLTNWLWPAYMAMCLRESRPTLNEIEMLSQHPLDVFIITDIREQTQFERNREVVSTEMHVRQLLNDEHHNAREPLTSDLSPPSSGFRLEIRSGDSMPEDVPGGVQATGKDGGARYIGSAILDTGEIIPGRVIHETSTILYAANGREHVASHFYLLPFDPLRIE
jgi:hypothetical protein